MKLFSIKFEFLFTRIFFADAHCEATVGWLEPLAQKVKDSPKTIVIPSIDGIDDRTIAFHGTPVSIVFAIFCSYSISI